MFHLVEHSTKRSGLVVGLNRNENDSSVDEIVGIVSKVLDIVPMFEYTSGGRSRTGDVPKMRISAEKLSAIWQESIYESTFPVQVINEGLTQEICSDWSTDLFLVPVYETIMTEK
jgi:UDP-glucose 4-epimerase